MKPFEEWQADGMAFDLVIAATSFHWIDPAVRYCKSAEVLGPCGALAIIHNNHIRQDEGFFAEVEPLYRQYYGPAKPLPPAEHTGTPQPEPGEECFEPPIRRNHLWSREYDAERYIKLLGTFSDHIRLPAERRDALFAGIRALINDRYGGRVVRHQEATLEIRELAR